MAQRSRAFNQRRPRRVERSRLLVVTEGTKTEIQYLEGLVQHLRASGTAVRGLRSRGVGRDPLRVLQAAVAMNEQDLDQFDELCVVVDVDDHATLDNALERALEVGVPMVVSNPCFEIWLLWHYEDCKGHRTSEQLATRLERMGHGGKDIPGRFPFEAHEQAEERAMQNPVRHTTKGSNPSSAMPHLLTSLKRSP